MHIKPLKVLKWLLQALAAVVVFLISNATIPGTVAVVSRFGWWSFPMLFGLGFFLSGVVLLLPFLKIDPKRFDRPWLVKLRTYGSFPLAAIATMVLGSIFGALVIRYLGLRGSKAWIYAFWVNAFASAASVAAYSGALTAVKSFLKASVFE